MVSFVAGGRKESRRARAEAIQGSRGQGGQIGAEGWGPIPESRMSVFSFELGGLPEPLGEWPRAVESLGSTSQSVAGARERGRGTAALGSAAQQKVTEGKGVLERASSMGGCRRAGRGPQAQRQVSLTWVDVARQRFFPGWSGMGLGWGMAHRAGSAFQASGQCAVDRGQVGRRTGHRRP